MLTVSVAATSIRLTTAQAVRDDLELTDDTATARLERLIDEASDLIARHCGRRLVRETVIETIRTQDGLDLLGLERWPVVSITSVVENGETLTENTDFEVDRAAGILQRLSSDYAVGWPAGKLVVTYVAGYIPADQSGSDVPPALSLACRRLVAAEYHGGGRDSRVRSERQEGIGSTDYFAAQEGDAGLPPGVASLLGPFLRLA